MKLLVKKLFILALITTSCLGMFAQTSLPQGINYQGVARNSSGALISNQAVSVKIGIHAASINGPLEWEETHAVSTNQFGLFNFVIGQGISTGNGSASSFSTINWSLSNHFMITAIDPAGGTSFIALDTTQFWSVPYALYSGSSGQLKNAIRLNDLTDVDTIGVTSGYVLKWNGSTWKPAPDNDSDTALYAFNANHSIHSDTSIFILNAKHAIQSDTAIYSFNSKTSTNSKNSNYCDTATYALNTKSVFTYWSLTGNSGTNPSTNFIGTIDSKDFVIKTNNTERLRVLANGKIGIGTSAPTASFQVNGDDGLLVTGTLASGLTISPGAGTRMHWYPKKGAFRVGYVSGTQWDDAKIGGYSFAAGNSPTASGGYSVAMGDNSIASGPYSVAMGNGCSSTKIAGVSMGSVCQATGAYAVALGREIIASDTSAVGIGYHSNATGKYSLAFGAYTTASGNYSTTMGWYANTNGKKGSFVYADNSSTVATNSTADNQFLVRASGGVILYSNSGLTVGVSLPAGGGSWASVSDRNKKTNFEKVDGDKILNGLETIEVSSWNYKTQSPRIRHIGPMAQDLYKAFQFGESDTTITSVDMDGINLIALKTLAIKTKELKKSADEVEQLKAEIERLEKEKLLLEKRIVLIEKKILSNGQ